MADIAQAGTTPSEDAVWKILVVDDEPAIHQVTRLALRNLSVLGRPSQLINALSAKDAREQVARHPDIAVVLLDVVMETEDAGLGFIRHLREELANPLVRIILRTGQPGQAPERQIMVDYDINDYKEKTELTAAKLYTSVMSSIRTFGHMQSMRNRERAIEVLGHLNAQVFCAGDAAGLARQLLAQLQALELLCAAACWTPGGAAWPAAHADAPGCTFGPWEPQADQRELRQLADDAPGLLVARERLYAATLVLKDGSRMRLALEAPQVLAAEDCRLLDLWLHSAAAALSHWTALAP